MYGLTAFKAQIFAWPVVRARKLDAVKTNGTGSSSNSSNGSICGDGGEETCHFIQELIAAGRAARLAPARAFVVA